MLLPVSGTPAGFAPDQAVACWGDNSVGQAQPPSGRFTAVTTGNWFSCGLRTNGTIACWGRNPDWDFGQSDAPSGQFTAVAAGGSSSCGLRTNGTIACWGRVPLIGLPSGVQFTNN